MDVLILSSRAGSQTSLISLQKHNRRSNLLLILFFLLIIMGAAAAAGFFFVLLFLSVQGGAVGYTRSDFPRDFVFGAATSAYQVTNWRFVWTEFPLPGFLNSACLCCACAVWGRCCRGWQEPYYLGHVRTWRSVFFFLGCCCATCAIHHLFMLIVIYSIHFIKNNPSMKCDTL